MYDLIIKNGRVVDPLNHIDGVMDVAIENGKIAEVASEITSQSKEVLDASGKIVMPGIIDMHTHMRDPRTIIIIKFYTVMDRPQMSVDIPAHDPPGIKFPVFNRLPRKKIILIGQGPPDIFEMAEPVHSVFQIKYILHFVLFDPDRHRHR